MFKKFLLILILSLLQSTISNANIIEVYCLITRSDLDSSNLDTKDHSRFLAKTIELTIDLDQSAIFNNIENLNEDETALFTGVLDFVRYDKKDIGEFATGRDSNKKITNTINYKHEIELESGTKYNYDNTIRLIDYVPVSIDLKVDQSGLSMNAWRFKIDCKGENYSTDERAKAMSNTDMQDLLKDSINRFKNN
jgi:hypothetical protein